MNVRPRAESNCAGFGVNDTRRMLLAAVPASKRPGLRLLRGSAALGYVCADMSAGAAMVAMKAISLLGLRIGTNSGVWWWGGKGSGNGKSLRRELGEQFPHDADLDGLRRDDIVREDVHVY